METLFERKCSRCYQMFTFKKEQFTKDAEPDMCQECQESVYGWFSKVLGEQTFMGG